jgi:spoIIIJ-associated protein
MAEMDEVEASGRTTEEALDRALNQLGLERSQVEVQVLSEGRAGILGIRGGQARVRVRPLPGVVPARTFDEDEEDDEQPDSRPFSGPASAPEDEYYEDEDADQAPAAELEPSEALDEAVDILQHLLDLMGLVTDVQARAPQTSGDGTGLVEAVLDVTGEDLGLLIGRRGDTLSALQYILNLMVRRRTHSHITFGIDVEGYRRRREATLNGLARRMADRVRQTGQSLTLEPMPPAERRIVHMALADDPDVLTVSIGEGDARKVAITPRH